MLQTNKGGSSSGTFPNNSIFCKLSNNNPKAPPHPPCSWILLTMCHFFRERGVQRSIFERQNMNWGIWEYSHTSIGNYLVLNSLGTLRKTLVWFKEMLIDVSYMPTLAPNHHFPFKYSLTRKKASSTDERSCMRVSPFKTVVTEVTQKEEN